MDESTANASAFDKFVAALTTLYRRFSVQLDAGATAGFTWLLSRTPDEQVAFLAHIYVQPWMIPPALFILRSVLVATPQPTVVRDTAVKAESRAAAKVDDAAKGDTPQP